MSENKSNANVESEENWKQREVLKEMTSILRGAESIRLL